MPNPVIYNYLQAIHQEIIYIYIYIYIYVCVCVCVCVCVWVCVGKTVTHLYEKELDLIYLFTLK